MEARRFSIGHTVVYGLLYWMVQGAFHLLFLWKDGDSHKTWPEIALTSVFFGLGMGVAMPALRRFEDRRAKRKHKPLS